MVEAIKEIWRKNSKVTIWIVGITKRPNEDPEFEKERRYLEETWTKEIERWQKNRLY